MFSTSTKTVQEFDIRVPKNVGKEYHRLAFNASLNIDFATWQNVTIERENDAEGDEGATKKRRAEAQPWILDVDTKKFKGIRHGGFDENAAYYVLIDTPDGAKEAYPIKEWYQFQPVQRYKSLSAEEAELEFGRRNKIRNYFAIMKRKRLKDAEEDKKDPEDNDKNVGKKSELQISDMVEWIDSDEESDSDEEECERKAKKKSEGKETYMNVDIDIETYEQLDAGDDGDEDEREIDYNTSSSEE